MKFKSNAGSIFIGKKEKGGDDNYEILRQIQSLKNDISRIEIMLQSLVKEVNDIPKIDKSNISCNSDEYRMELRRNTVNTQSRLIAFNKYINPITWYRFKDKLGTDMIGISSLSCISNDGMNTLKQEFGLNIPNRNKCICLLICVDKDYYRLNKFMEWTDIADLVIDSLFPYYKDIKVSLSVSKIFTHTHIYYLLEVALNDTKNYTILNATGIHNAIVLMNSNIINSVHNKQIANMVQNTKLSTPDK